MLGLELSSSRQREENRLVGSVAISAAATLSFNPQRRVHEHVIGIIPTSSLVQAAAMPLQLTL